MKSEGIDISSYISVDSELLGRSLISDTTDVLERISSQFFSDLQLQQSHLSPKTTIYNKDEIEDIQSQFKEVMRLSWRKTFNFAQLQNEVQISDTKDTSESEP